MPLTADTHAAALELAREHGFAFYDALIVVAAIEADCDILYSEDMQHGRAIGGLTIVNPLSRGFTVRSGMFSKKKFIYYYYKDQSAHECACQFPLPEHIQTLSCKALHFFREPMQLNDRLRLYFRQCNYNIQFYK